MTTELEAPAPTATAPRPNRTRKPRKRPVRRLMIVTHRWASLVLGILLLVITTSGAILVYKPEIVRTLDHDAYATSGGARQVSFGEAYAAVKKAHPSYAGTSVVLDRGVYRVTDFETSWNVDPATGKVLGKSGEHTWLAWLDNLHECSLSCEGEPGYVGFLAKEIPRTTWLGHDGAKITYGGLLLGVLGLLTLWLSLTGVWLWWPRWKAVKQSMSVRWRRGRFARDTDLHKVAGMIAVPLLLVWGLTGAGFEIGPVRDAYTAVTPGTYQDAPEATSATGAAPDISMDEAVKSAEDLAGKPVVYVTAPDAKDKNAIYDFYVDSGRDPYAYGGYPGDIGIAVDRRTAKATYTYSAPGTSASQVLWDNWSYPGHAGYFTNGWWRAIWFVLGMSPLLLAITGVSTWLVRRKANAARRRARRTAADAVRSGA